MKRSIPVTSFCLFVAASLSAHATVYSSIPNVFSTGVDGSGNVLSAGTVDPHYTITSSPSGAASARVTSPFFMWAGGTASSAWINSSGTATDNPDGDYT
jgi:hypothetical protein